MVENGSGSLDGQSQGDSVTRKRRNSPIWGSDFHHFSRFIGSFLAVFRQQWWPALDVLISTFHCRRCAGIRNRFNIFFLFLSFPLFSSPPFSLFSSPPFSSNQTSPQSFTLTLTYFLLLKFFCYIFLSSCYTLISSMICLKYSGG